MDLGLAGKIVVVTGGSSGIGRAAAIAFGREGARVAITFHSHPENAAETVRLLEAAGADAMATRLALGEPPSIAAAFAAIVAKWGGVDVLVANAVDWPVSASLDAANLDDWSRSVTTNVAGTAGTVQQAIASMAQRGGGRIVIISTGVAEEGMARASAYLAGKAALHGLARSLAWEFGHANILINVLAAGFTRTEKNLALIPDAIRDAVAARIPTRRLSRPDEVAAVIVFLASAANSNMSGEIVHEGSSTGRSAHTM